MADIKVTAIKLIPTSPGANSLFSAVITVKNQGSAPANGGYLDVWANQGAEQTCGAFGEEWIDIGSLDAGASKTLTLSLRSNGAGSKKLRAFADSWCQTSESNEANNQMTKTYTVK
jgi:subtilase family serine protease